MNAHRLLSKNKWQKHGRLCPNLKWRVKGNFKNQNDGSRFWFGSTVNQAQITGGFGLDWLGWSAGKFKTTPTILIFQIFLGKTHSSEVKIVTPTLYSLIFWATADVNDLIAGENQHYLRLAGASLPHQAVFSRSDQRGQRHWRQVALLGGQYVLQSFFQQAFEAASKL